MPENTDEFFMNKALELAMLGFANTRPNPMVGAVLVLEDQIIGQGYHKIFGDPHAEVEAFNDAVNKGYSAQQIADSTLYVTLEPCCHQGKTPPCVESIKDYQVKKVIIATLDPNPLVAGKSIDILKANGVDLHVGVLEDQAKKLNKRFFTYHENNRPYVILKWAQTSDGFIAKSDFSSPWITTEKSKELVHKWRDQEMAIIVGTNTAVYDNPNLTSRIKGGRNPIRVLVDREQRVPTSFNLFDEKAKTILYNELEDFNGNTAELVKIDFSTDVLDQILSDLHKRGIQSLIVEGGTKLLQSFIDKNIWDEARIFTAPKKFGQGIAAPVLERDLKFDCINESREMVDVDILNIIEKI